MINLSFNISLVYDLKESKFLEEKKNFKNGEKIK